MSRRTVSNILAMTILFFSPIVGAQSPARELKELVQAYTILTTHYGSKFSNHVEKCEDWAVELCQLQRNLEKTSSRLASNMAFVRKIEEVQNEMS